MPAARKRAGEVNDVFGEAAGLLRHGNSPSYSAALQLRAHLVDQLLRLGAFEARDVVLILEQHAERVGDGRRIERDHVELGQRRRPVERLGDAGRLEQILLAQGLHEMHDLLRQRLADARHLGAHDLQFARGVRIADPVIEAAALERVVDFAGAVRGDHHDRRMRRLHGAELRDGHLEIREHLQEKRLERFVGAVELVDQQHRRARRIGLERLQQRPLDQEALGEHVVLEPLAVVAAFGLGDADRDHLRGIVPLVDRGRDVEPFVALQPDQAAPERRREHLGDLGLADAGLALEKQRAAHPAARETARSRASGRRDSPPTPAGRASRRSRGAANGAPASGSWSRAYSPASTGLSCQERRRAPHVVAADSVSAGRGARFIRRPCRA